MDKNKIDIRIKKYLKPSIVIFLLICFLVVSTHLLSDADVRPKPKQMKLSGKNVRVGPESELTTSIVFSSRFKSSINSFIKSLTNLPLTDNNIPITIRVFSNTTKNSLSNDVVIAFNHREGYWIKITSNGIKILGADELGALHGLSTLEKLIVSGKGEIPQGYILDWPDHKIRALHLVLGTTEPEEIKRLIKSARFGHYNTLILDLATGVHLSSMTRVIRPSFVSNVWTKEELLDVVNFAKENGLDVIPQLNLLTQQHKLLRDTYPYLMFNKFTYDPRKEKIYDIVLPIIDEIIDLLKPEVFHIGHDEVKGLRPSKKEPLRPGEVYLPPELFLKDVMRLYNHLQKKGVKIWMWGDMLIAPEEFPEMLERHLHGTNGYAALRKKIPEEIVVCDWHYDDRQTEFPSVLAFAMAGHKVLGATWRRPETIRNFSKYVRKMPFGGEGMIATTWSHLLHKEWDIVHKIIEASAEAFWNAK